MAPQDKSSPSPLLSKDQGGPNRPLKDIIKDFRDRGYDKVTVECDHTEQLSKITGESPPRRMWWDWLQLLIIPLLIAGLGIGFTWVQNQTSLQIADDQQREAALQTYLDRMSDLLLGNNTGQNSPTLISTKPGDEISNVARARTLTALKRLDPQRKGTLLKFLYESGSIGTVTQKNSQIERGNAKVSLNGADLSKAILNQTDLGGVDLSGTNLSRANLSYNISLTMIGGASMSGWGDTTFPPLNASLDYSSLSGANLAEADLSGASLFDANLDSADLQGANLSRAGLQGASLVGVNLSGADLSGANLRGADVLPEKLKQAKSLKGATMRNGSKHP